MFERVSFPGRVGCSPSGNMSRWQVEGKVADQGLMIRRQIMKRAGDDREWDVHQYSSRGRGRRNRWRESGEFNSSSLGSARLSASSEAEVLWIHGICLL